MSYSSKSRITWGFLLLGVDSSADEILRPKDSVKMGMIFFLLTVCGIVLEIIGIFGIIRQQVKGENHPNAFKVLLGGLTCHGVALLISYI
jgi:hypothetical protein